MSITINDTKISHDTKPYIIAEAGVHHYGSMEIAKEYIRSAKIAGADSIKFQTYTAKGLVTEWAPIYWVDPNRETQFEVFSTVKGFSKKQYKELFNYAREVGIEFLSTPFDIEGARMLNDLGMTAFKVASADLTNIPLLKEVSSYHKPIILSTGASYIHEIKEALSAIQEFHNDVAILHCSLSYPTPLAHSNLARLRLLEKEFPRILLGYSDHTLPSESNLACPLSVTLGGRIIEKHFSLNTFHSGHDHYHSVDVDGLSRLVNNCHGAFLMSCGSPIEVTDVERDARKHARRSIVANIDIEEGKIISENDVTFKRPGSGLSPSKLDSIIGRVAKHSISRDALVTLEDVE